MRWEYTNIMLDDETPFDEEIPELNKLGAEGWELVSVVAPEGFGQLVYYFKRQVFA